MKNSLIVATLWLSILSAPAVQAATLMGPGVVSCGKFVTERERDGAAMYTRVAWALGYLSGRASTDNAHVFGGTVDAAAIRTWLDEYCRQNPLDGLSDATEGLYQELKKRRAR